MSTAASFDNPANGESGTAARGNNLVDMFCSSSPKPKDMEDGELVEEEVYAVSRGRNDGRVEPNLQNRRRRSHGPRALSDREQIRREERERIIREERANIIREETERVRNAHRAAIEAEVREQLLRERAADELAAARERKARKKAKKDKKEKRKKHRSRTGAQGEINNSFTSSQKRISRHDPRRVNSDERWKPASRTPSPDLYGDCSNHIGNRRRYAYPARSSSRNMGDIGHHAALRKSPSPEHRQRTSDSGNVSAIGRSIRDKSPHPASVYEPGESYSRDAESKHNPRARQGQKSPRPRGRVAVEVLPDRRASARESGPTRGRPNRSPLPFERYEREQLNSTSPSVVHSRGGVKRRSRSPSTRQGTSRPSSSPAPQGDWNGRPPLVSRTTARNGDNRKVTAALLDASLEGCSSPLQSSSLPGSGSHVAVKPGGITALPSRLVRSRSPAVRAAGRRSAPTRGRRGSSSPPRSLSRSRSPDRPAYRGHQRGYWRGRGRGGYRTNRGRGGYCRRGRSMSRSRSRSPQRSRSPGRLRDTHHRRGDSGRYSRPDNRRGFRKRGVQDRSISRSQNRSPVRRSGSPPLKRVRREASGSESRRPTSQNQTASDGPYDVECADAGPDYMDTAFVDGADTTTHKLQRCRPGRPLQDAPPGPALVTGPADEDTVADMPIAAPAAPEAGQAGSLSTTDAVPPAGGKPSTLDGSGLPSGVTAGGGTAAAVALSSGRRRGWQFGKQIPDATAATAVGDITSASGGDVINAGLPTVEDPYSSMDAAGDTLAPPGTTAVVVPSAIGPTQQETVAAWAKYYGFAEPTYEFYQKWYATDPASYTAYYNHYGGSAPAK